MKILIYLSLVIILTSALILSCSRGGTPEIKVKGPKVVGKGDIAIFLLIVNDGNGSDSLTGCSLKEFPEVKGEMHDIIDGQMKEVEEIRVPAHGLVALKRGGLHLMFFGLPDELPEKMTLNLQFRKSGNMEIKVPARRS